MLLKITKAKALTTREVGTDIVWLDTELPATMPAVDPSPLTVKFEVRKGHGIQYLLDNFPGIPVEKIDGVTGKRERVR
jgi:hypothetical protein